MTPDQTGAAAAERAAAEWLARHGAAAGEDLVRASVSAVDRVRGSIAALSGSGELAAEGSLATEELVRLALKQATNPRPVTSGPSPAMEAAVRVWARRGVDLAQLRYALRDAQAEFWRHWMSDVSARIDDHRLLTEVLDLSWRRIAAWQTTQAAHLDDIYTQERDRWLQAGHALRAEAIDALLAGPTPPPADIDAILRYRLAQTHTSVILHSAAGVTQPLDALHDTLRTLAAALDGPPRPILVMPVGSRLLWAWIGTGSVNPVDAWAGVTLPAEVSIAVGRPAFGPNGFRASHQEAQLVRQVTAQQSHPARVTHYDDVEIPALLSANWPALQRMVAHHLGALAEDDEPTKRLRHTLHAYLASGSNARATAERLHLHKNTVHYRLAQIEERLGHPIATNRLGLEVALTVLDTLGEALPRQPQILESVGTKRRTPPPPRVS